METFKVFGKLKRKELSFGSFNDVRGVNKREERLLRSALGSLERQRKRSLLNIQNEVEDLHITLKETKNIWQGDGHPVQEQVHIQTPKYQTPKTSNKKTKVSKVADKQNTIKENFQGISNPKEVSESRKNSLAPSLQHVNTSTANTSNVNDRILHRPRNTSTGSMPNNMIKGETAHTVFDLNLRKSSNPSEYRLPNGARTTLMATGGTTFIKDELAFHKRDHQRSVSSENITLSREKLSTAPFFTPQIRQKKLSAESGSLSSISSSPRDSPIFIRKIGKAQSFNSFGNVSAESCPMPTRQATVADRFLCRSVVGHKPMKRMISCPQLSCSPKTNEYRTLSSMSGERSLSRMSTELPELMAAQKLHNGKREENEENYRCVSPNNLERATMDKNLQNRINAFLNSLTENDTCVEDIE